MRKQRRRMALAISLTVSLAVLLGAGAAVNASAPATFHEGRHTVLPLFVPHDYKGKPLRVITVIGKDPKPKDATSFDNRVLWFGHALVRSAWYTAASKAYQLGPHGTAGQIRLDGPMPVVKPGVTIATIEAKLRHWMDEIHVKRDPAARSIFVMYLPCVPGTQIQIAQCGESSFHPQLAVEANDPNFTEGDSMVFVLMPEHNGKPVTVPLTQATVDASHEIIESTTDSPAPGQHAYFLKSAEPNTPFDVSPWVFNEGSKLSQTEVADMGGGARISLKFTDAPHTFTYVYDRFYTPATGRHAGDPFAPKSPVPFNSVSTSPGWITDSIDNGGTVQIPFRGWSTAAIKAWSVRASVPQWQGHGADPTTPRPCQVSLDRKTINNNVVGILTVKRVPGVTLTVNDWCAIKIVSSTPDPTGAHNDEYHQWLTGVRFVK
jgi:hypothetical protein